MPILQEQKSVTQPSRKKCIFRGALNCIKAVTGCDPGFKFAQPSCITVQLIGRCVYHLLSAVNHERLYA